MRSCFSSCVCSQAGLKEGRVEPLDSEDNLNKTLTEEVHLPAIPLTPHPSPLTPHFIHTAQRPHPTYTPTVCVVTCDSTRHP